MKKVFLEMYLKKNLGDDLFLQSIARRYEDVIFYTTAKNNYFDEFDFKNVRGRSFIKKILDKAKELFLKKKFGNNRKYSASIIFGGSMFIEKTKDEKGLLGELKKRYNGKTPLFVIGSNFGPYNNKFYRDTYKKVFEKAEDICFRDRYSVELFSDLNNVRLAPDVVFNLDIAKYEVRQEKKIIISVINLENRSNLKKYLKIYENKIIEITHWYVERGYEVVLMSFCKYEGDEDTVRRILAEVPGGKVYPYYYRGNIDEALEQIASSEIVVGTRFHAVVLGLIFGKKVLPIVYSNKIKNMLEDINFGGKLIKIEDINNMKIARINAGLSCYGEIKKLSKDAEKHFEKLDMFFDKG